MKAQTGGGNKIIVISEMYQHQREAFSTGKRPTKLSA